MNNHLNDDLDALVAAHFEAMGLSVSPEPLASAADLQVSAVPAESPATFRAEPASLVPRLPAAETVPEAPAVTLIPMPSPPVSDGPMTRRIANLMTPHEAKALFLQKLKVLLPLVLMTRIVDARAVSLCLGLAPKVTQTFIQRLLQKRLLQAVLVPRDPELPGGRVFMLSEQGVELARRYSPVPVSHTYSVQPGELRYNQLMHDLCVARACAWWVGGRHGVVLATDFTDRANGNAAGRNSFDATLRRVDGVLVALEVERTGKKDREYDEKMLAWRPLDIDAILVVCMQAWLARTWQQLAARERLPLWEKLAGKPPRVISSVNHYTDCRARILVAEAVPESAWWDVCMPLLAAAQLPAQLRRRQQLLRQRMGAFMLTRLLPDDDSDHWYFEDSTAAGEGWMVRVMPDGEVWCLHLLRGAELREFDQDQITKLVSLPIDPREVDDRRSRVHQQLEEDLYVAVKSAWGFPPVAPA